MSESPAPTLVWVEIRGTLQWVDGALRAVTPKTKKSRRTVPLIELCLEVLISHRRLQAKERFAAGEKWVDTGYVFTTEIGTPIEPDNLRRTWYPLRDEADLGKMRFHDLRHSCVTLLLRLKVPAPHRSGDRRACGCSGDDGGLCARVS